MGRLREMVDSSRLMEKKFVRYNEGCEIYSMGRNSFAKLAKDAGAIYKVNNVVLVNPVNDDKNSALYAQYAELAKKEDKVIFGGRLGEYKYYDMDAVIAAALGKYESVAGKWAYNV